MRDFSLNTAIQEAQSLQPGIIDQGQILHAKTQISGLEIALKKVKYLIVKALHKDVKL
jgi:hypothetical protein